MSPLQELGGDVGWALHVSEQAILLSRIEAAADHAAEQKKRKDEDDDFDDDPDVVCIDWEHAMLLSS